MKFDQIMIWANITIYYGLNIGSQTYPMYSLANTACHIFNILTIICKNLLQEFESIELKYTYTSSVCGQTCSNCPRA